MKYLWTGVVVGLLAVSCATRVERQQIHLSDVDRRLARDHAAEPQVNRLHPSNAERGRFAWLDLCATKECSGMPLRYTRLSRRVALAAATIAQLHFVTEQIESGEVRPHQVEGALEYGWKKLPNLEREFGRLRSEVEGLNPDDDFRNSSLRTLGWDVVALAAEQLERADGQLPGLNGSVARLYKKLEAESECPEPEPPDGIVFPVSPELKQRMTQAMRALKPDAASPDDVAMVRLLVQRGVKAVESEQAVRRREAAAESPFHVESLEVDGPLEPDAARRWLADRSDALLACMPSNDAVELELMSLYSAQGVIDDVRTVGTAATPAARDCIRNALEGTAIVADIPGEGGGMRMRVALNPGLVAPTGDESIRRESRATE